MVQERFNLCDWAAGPPMDLFKIENWVCKGKNKRLKQ